MPPAPASRCTATPPDPLPAPPSPLHCRHDELSAVLLCAEHTHSQGTGPLEPTPHHKPHQPPAVPAVSAAPCTPLIAPSLTPHAHPSTPALACTTSCCRHQALQDPRAQAPPAARSHCRSQICGGALSCSSHSPLSSSLSGSGCTARKCRPRASRLASSHPSASSMLSGLGRQPPYLWRECRWAACQPYLACSRTGHVA